MSSKKPSQNTSNQKGKPPRFIKPKVPEGDLVQISLRIPSAEKARFEAAQQVLRANGWDMDLTKVIRCALADAAAYVEEAHKPQSTAGEASTPKEGAEREPNSALEVLADSCVE